MAGAIPAIGFRADGRRAGTSITGAGTSIAGAELSNHVTQGTKGHREGRPMTRLTRTQRTWTTRHALLGLGAAAILLAVTLVVWAALDRSGEQAGDPAATAGHEAAAEADARFAATARDGRAAARALLKQSGAASLSLALIDGDEVVWRQSFGYADEDAGTRPQPTTMYGVGSVSKILAAVATMKLVDQGRVSLDAPVTRYVPEFTTASPEYRQITVRMLLDHSSGFPGSEYRDCFTNEYLPGYVDETLAALAGSRLKHTPGLLNVYCNDGFTVIERLVHNVTGKTYAEFVDEQILTPLGMTHSAYPLQPFPAGSFAMCSTKTAARPLEVLSCLCAGGLYSTPTDMGKLASMLMNEGISRGTHVLSAASVAEMGTDQTAGSFRPVPSGGFRYGLGWDSVRDPGLAKVGVTAWVKGGDSNDYHAGFIVAPEAGLAVVVTGVAPLSSADCEALGETILLHALVDKGTIPRLPKKLPDTPPEPKQATPQEMRAMTGSWAGIARVLRVSAGKGASGADGHTLTISQLTADGWAPMAEGLRPRIGGSFQADDDSAAWRAAEAGGRRYLVRSAIAGYGHYRDDLAVAEKLSPRAPLSTAWRRRVGRTWLSVNDAASSPLYNADGGPLLTLTDFPGLSGYVVVLDADGAFVLDPGESDETALTFLQIPPMGSRDLDDLSVEERVVKTDEEVRDGTPRTTTEEWLRSAACSTGRRTRCPTCAWDRPRSRSAQTAWPSGGSSPAAAG